MARVDDGLIVVRLDQDSVSGWGKGDLAAKFRKFCLLAGDRRQWDGAVARSAGGGAKQ